jgi:chloride channel 7
MITLLTAKSVGDLFNEGIYDTHVGLKFMPFLEQQPPSLMRHLTAHDIMAKEVVEFGAVERVGYIMEALEKTTHNGFPVLLRNLELDQNAEYDDEVHEASTFAGCILRSQLLVILQMRNFMASPEAPQTEDEMVEMYDFANIDFSKVPTSAGLKVEDIKLTDDEQEMYINLLPFVNPNPYVVQQDTSLGKVYNLFRGCALRHLFVIKRVPQIVGMITRKDLLHEFAEERHKTKTLGSAKRLERSSVLRQQKESSGQPDMWSPRNSKQKPLKATETVEVPLEMLSPRGAELRKKREANSPPMSPRRSGSRQNSPDGTRRMRAPLDQLAAMDEVEST